MANTFQFPAVDVAEYEYQYEDNTEVVYDLMMIMKDFENIAELTKDSMVMNGINPTPPTVRSVTCSNQLSEDFERGLQTLAQHSSDAIQPQREDAVSASSQSSLESWKSSTTDSSMATFNLQSVPGFMQARRFFVKHWAVLTDFADGIVRHRSVDWSVKVPLAAFSALAMKWKADQLEFVIRVLYQWNQSVPLPNELIQGLRLMARCECDADDGIYDSCTLCSRTICKVQFPAEADSLSFKVR